MTLASLDGHRGLLTPPANNCLHRADPIIDFSRDFNMRVGRVVRLVYDRSFGFIQADEFREDVFFHFSVVDRTEQPDRWEVGLEVEFELDDLLKMNQEKLQATLVIPSRRPLTMGFSEQQERQYQASHHPKARRRKPLWRAPRENPASPPPMQDEGQTDILGSSDK